MDSKELGYWMAAGTDPYQEVAYKLKTKTEGIGDVVEAFCSRIKTTSLLCDIPSRVSIIGQEMRNTQIASCIALFGKPRLGETLTNSKEAADMHQLTFEFITKKRDPCFPIAFRGIRSDYIIHQMYDHVIDTICESIMMSQILLFWLAFETLAANLWERAANLRPVKLAKYTNNINNREGAESDQKKDGKMMPMFILQKYKFDISGKMGTILRECGKVGFQTLDDIKISYIGSFPDSCDAGKRDFWGDKSLQAMCALRNVIVHRAGKIDKEFINNRGTHPSVSSLQIGDAYNPKGKDIQTIFKEFTRFCTSLIRSVDEWLEANPV